MADNIDKLNDVIDNCSKKIEPLGMPGEVKNKAKYPVIILYAGDYVIKHYGIVCNIIDKNWRNFNYIYHLGVSENEVCNLNSSGTDGKVSIEDGGVNLDNFFGEALRAPENMFSVYNRMEVKIIVSAGDGDAINHIDMVSNIRTSFPGLNIDKDLFILAYQDGSERHKNTIDLSKKVLERETEGKLDSFQQIFIISNAMISGKVLDKREEKSNFALIASTILLTNNEDDNYINAISAKGKYRVLSYKVVKKPCREIVIELFRELINDISSIPEEKRYIIIRSFRDDKFCENYFAENFKNLMPEGEDFKYLPYADDSIPELKKEFNNCRTAGGLLREEDIDNWTYGCYSKFYELNYRDCFEKNFDKESFCNELENKLISEYSYKDMSSYFGDPELMGAVCEKREIRIEEGHQATPYDFLSRQCYYKAQNDFLGYTKPEYINILRSLKGKAEYFNQLMAGIKSDIGLLSISENTSIQRFYSNYMQEYFDEHKNEILKELNVKIESYDDLLIVIERIFNEMLNIDNGLKCNYVDELKKRMHEASNPGERDKLISDELTSNIDNYIRINFSNDNRSEIFDAYLCHKGSGFLNNIGGGNYKTFYTNDENRFEHLKIYEFSTIDDIIFRAEVQ